MTYVHVLTLQDKDGNIILINLFYSRDTAERCYDVLRASFREDYKLTLDKVAII